MNEYLEHIMIWLFGFIAGIAILKILQLKKPKERKR